MVSSSQITAPAVRASPDETNKEQQKPAPGMPLDNPLPLPKKHVKKSVDFPYEIAEDKMQFDHKVDENDDYDY